MTDFGLADVAAHTTAHGLLAQDIEAEEIANAFIVQGLSVWQASVGENDDAYTLLLLWSLVRDAADGRQN